MLLLLLLLSYFREPLSVCKANLKYLREMLSLAISSRVIQCSASDPSFLLEDMMYPISWNRSEVALVLAPYLKQLLISLHAHGNNNNIHVENKLSSSVLSLLQHPDVRECLRCLIHSETFVTSSSQSFGSLSSSRTSSSLQTQIAVSGGISGANSEDIENFSD